MKKIIARRNYFVTQFLLRKDRRLLPIAMDGDMTFLSDRPESPTTVAANLEALSVVVSIVRARGGFPDVCVLNLEDEYAISTDRKKSLPLPMLESHGEIGALKLIGACIKPGSDIAYFRKEMEDYLESGGNLIKVVLWEVPENTEKVQARYWEEINSVTGGRFIFRVVVKRENWLDPSARKGTPASMDSVYQNSERARNEKDNMPLNPHLLVVNKRAGESSRAAVMTALARSCKHQFLMMNSSFARELGKEIKEEYFRLPKGEKEWTEELISKEMKDGEDDEVKRKHLEVIRQLLAANILKETMAQIKSPPDPVQVHHLQVLLEVIDNGAEDVCFTAIKNALNVASREVGEGDMHLAANFNTDRDFLTNLEAQIKIAMACANSKGLTLIIESLRPRKNDSGFRAELKGKLKGLIKEVAGEEEGAKINLAKCMKKIRLNELLFAFFEQCPGYEIVEIEDGSTLGVLANQSGTSISEKQSPERSKFTITRTGT